MLINTKIGQRLDDLPNNLIPAQAETARIDLIGEIKAWIIAYPGQNLNNILL